MSDYCPHAVQVWSTTWMIPLGRDGESGHNHILFVQYKTMGPIHATPSTSVSVHQHVGRSSAAKPVGLSFTQHGAERGEWTGRRICWKDVSVFALLRLFVRPVR